MSTTVPAPPAVSIGEFGASIFATLSDVLWFAPAAQRRPLAWRVDVCAYCGLDASYADVVGPLTEFAWSNADGMLLRCGAHVLGCAERLSVAAARWSEHGADRLVMVGG